MKKHALFCLLMVTFYLGIYKNQVALWKYGNNTPITVYPYSISIFTENDQTLLKNGIDIRTKAEITKHLDDFLS